MLRLRAGLWAVLGGGFPPKDLPHKPPGADISGGVPVSTGMRKRDQRAVAPGHLNNGHLYKLKNNNNTVLAAA